MWKVSCFYEKVDGLANFGDYAAILLLHHFNTSTGVVHNQKC